MKKILLSTSLGLLAFSASAKSEVYFFNSDPAGSDFPVMGEVYAISENGEYAVFTDEDMNNSYLWRKSDPTALEYLNWKVDNRIVPLDIRGITNNGTMVGSYRSYGSSTWEPFVKPMGGEVVPLPVPEWTLTLNYPVAITEDENIIAGYVGRRFTPEGQTSHGQQVPIIWSKGSDGEYTMNVNQDIQQYEGSGMTPMCMISDGTVGGTYLGGYLGIGAGSFIPGIYHNGEVTIWHDITYAQVPFYYKGQVLGYDRLEIIDGKQDMHFSDSDILTSMITCADREGHFYGSRVEVGTPESTNPDDENFGKTKDTQYWGYFSIKDGEWTDVQGNKVVTAALNPNIIFCRNQVYVDGIKNAAQSVPSYLDFDASGLTLDGVGRVSGDGQVLGLVHHKTEETGTYYYPFMIVLDEPLVGIEDVVVDTDNQHVVVVRQGAIEVIGASQAAVYDMSGICVGNAVCTGLSGGTYIVVADGVSHKVLVK